MDRWKEEVTLVQNETWWMHLWLNTIGKSGKEGKKRVNKRFERHACYAWKQVRMWERMANEAMDVYSRVML